MASYPYGHNTGMPPPIMYQPQPQGYHFSPPPVPPPPPPGGVVGYQQQPGMPLPPETAFGRATIPCKKNLQWIPMPTGGITGECPPGLEYLTVIDRVVVQQMIEPLEVITGYETCNRYILKNSVGLQIYYAFESSDECERQCCGSKRGFTIHIVDNVGTEVLRIIRPYKCCGGCCCACGEACQYKVLVQAPPGVQITSVTQIPGCCNTNFVIKDQNETWILTVRGPPACVCPCSDKKYPVLMGKTRVGDITKHWSGWTQEMYTDADNFSVSFPLHLDVKFKAALIGLLFLIDFISFED